MAGGTGVPACESLVPQASVPASAWHCSIGQTIALDVHFAWIPAFAGMTIGACRTFLYFMAPQLKHGLVYPA